jgi:IS5 family transposase
MLKPRSPQESFYGSYLYDRIVPVDHLLRKINQVVDFSFARQLFEDRYQPDIGRPAEDPEFMLRLCLLQYIYGDSDRQVVENARLNLAYKYFLGLAVDAEVPDYTTVSYFRIQRLGEEKFRSVLEQIIRQCIDKGLVKGKRQIIDSTPVMANISSSSSLTGLVRKCRENVLKTIAKQDKQAAEKLGLKELQSGKQVRVTATEEGLRQEMEAAGVLLDGVTAELKVKRLTPNEELKKDLELLEKAVADREEKAKDKLLSPVDPDARMGKKTSKVWPGYKAHIIMEEETGIITSVETTPANTTDGSQLQPMIKEQEKALSLRPQELTADKAYDWGEILESLAHRQITANIALSKQVNHRNSGYFSVDNFLYDPVNVKLMCPAGHISTNCYNEVLYHYQLNKPGYAFRFRPTWCNVCPLKPKCVKNRAGRRVYISYYEPYFRQARERLATEEGKAAYRNRYRIEQKVADLTRYCGLRRCRYRRLDRAQIHTLLATTVCNIKRMVKLLWGKPEGYYLESLAAV